MKYYKVTFIFKGKQEEIVIKSLNKAEAIIDAKKFNKGILVKIEEIPMPIEEKIKIFKEIFKNNFLRKKINYPAYISAIRQLAVLLKAGISLKDALEDIANNTKDNLIKEIFSNLVDAINSGKSLSNVFRDYESYVGSISLSMVKLGEQTGDLAYALESLANIYENIYKNRKKMIKALRYPIITLIAIVLAFTFLILVIVPKFKAIFEQLKAELPLPTKILLLIEEVLSNYGLLFLGGLIIISIVITYLYKTSYEFKVKVDKILLKIYLIREIIEYSFLHRFLMSLSSLLKSGIPLVDALKISESIINNEVLKNKIKEVINGINQGRSLTEIVTKQQLFNFITLRMISAGEESGELDIMLESAAKYYEDRFQDMIDNLQAAIEPIMIAVIGGLVLLLALGIFMPMWDLASALKNL